MHEANEFANESAKDKHETNEFAKDIQETNETNTFARGIWEASDRQQQENTGQNKVAERSVTHQVSYFREHATQLKVINRMRGSGAPLMSAYLDSNHVHKTRMAAQHQRGILLNIDVACTYACFRSRISVTSSNGF